MQNRIGRLNPALAILTHVMHTVNVKVQAMHNSLTQISGKKIMWTACVLTSVSNGGVEVRRTCARVSTLMPTVCSSKRVGGNLDVSTLFGRAESTQFRYLS